MYRIATPLFVLLVLVGVTSSIPAKNVQGGEQIYTCEPIYYPDGTEGVAIVRVKFATGGGPYGGHRERGVSHPRLRPLPWPI